jgi:hypothetical protein
LRGAPPGKTTYDCTEFRSADIAEVFRRDAKLGQAIRRALKGGDLRQTGLADRCIG